MKTKGAAQYLIIIVLLSINIPSVIAVEGIVSLSPSDIKDHELATKEPENHYVDKLIDPDVSEDPSLDELEKEISEEREKEPEGIRAYQLNLDYKNTGDEQTSQTVGLTAYRQTSQYGSLRFNLSSSKIAPQIEDSGQNGIVNIQNINLALSPKYYADTRLGVVSGDQHPLLSYSRYQSLPVQTFAGASTRLYSSDAEIRLTQGTLGDIVNESFFRSKGISVTGLGYAKKLKDEWFFASQSWLVNDAEEGRSTEVAATIMNEQGPWRSKQLQLVANNKAQGLSFEAALPLQRARNRFGAYYLGKGLTWQGRSISDDNQGLFFQSNYQSPRFSINSSIDIQQSHLHDEEEKKQKLTASQRHNYNFNKSVIMGGGVRLSKSADIGRGEDKEDDYQMDAFISKYYASGFSHRAQMSIAKRASRVDQRKENQRKLSLDYSLNWLLPKQINMGWQVGVEQSVLDQNDAERNVSTGLTLSRSFKNSSYLSSNIRYIPKIDAGDESRWNANISYDLPINKNWSTNTYVNYGASDGDDADAKIVTDDEYAFGLNVVYSKQSGRRFEVKGRGKGNQLGSIEGIVFFDKNNDGIRQPSEKFAEKIRLRLDGGYTVITNTFGEFEFSLVRTGMHYVSIDLDSVPLPWEIKSPPGKIDVKLREATRMNFPLSLINGQDVE